jgi:hypothetical protein
MPVLADLFFALQVPHFELLMGFVIHVLTSLGLDMQVCWGFWVVGQFEIEELVRLLT